MSWIHNRWILPYLERERHSGLGGRLRELSRFDAASAGEQMAVQAAKLREILSHAYASTPYYRQLFDEAGFRPATWQSGDSLSFPVLTRGLLRKNGNVLRSTTHTPDQLRTAVTGGTTGTPIQLWRDVEGLRRKTALQYHLDRAAGFHHGDPVLLIWGAERDLALNVSWQRKFYDQNVMRRFPAPAGQINEDVFASFLMKLNRHRPKVLYGYSATMARFAEYLRATGKPYHRPTVIIATAEPLVDGDRQILEETFGAKVTEHYGSRDIGMVASECSHHAGLHFHPAGCFVEFAYSGETPAGPMYKLILTDLLNYGMPLIRYDTDDCVLLADGPCACGRWHPRIRRILGRDLDNFELADGAKVPGIALTVHMARVSGGFRHVTQVQFVQKELDHILIRFAAVGEEMDVYRELYKVRDCVQELFPGKLRWSFSRVAEIKRERSGKLRMCISEVNRDQPVHA